MKIEMQSQRPEDRPTESKARRSTSCANNKICVALFFLQLRWWLLPIWPGEIVGSSWVAFWSLVVHDVKVCLFVYTVTFSVF